MNQRERLGRDTTLLQKHRHSRGGPRWVVHRRHYFDPSSKGLILPQNVLHIRNLSTQPETCLAMSAVVVCRLEVILMPARQLRHGSLSDCIKKPPETSGFSTRLYRGNFPRRVAGKICTYAISHVASSSSRTFDRFAKRRLPNRCFHAV